MSMQLALSTKDYEIIDLLLESEVLKNIGENQSGQKNDATVRLVCGCTSHHFPRTFHSSPVIAVNGGPLVCHTHSPLVMKRGVTLSDDIFEMALMTALKMKIGTMLLVNHMPCFWSRDSGLSPFQQMKVISEVYSRFWQRTHCQVGQPPINIIGHLHVDYAGKEQIYAIDHSALDECLRGRRLLIAS